MIKKLVSITEYDVKLVSEKAKNLGISFSEMLRRIIQYYRINKGGLDEKSET